MKNNNYIKVTFLALLILVSSCTKDFKELAVNPNNSEFALPQTLLAPALTSLVSFNMGRSQRINNELMQVHIDLGDTEGKIFRYDIRSTESTAMWNNWYLQLANIRDVYSGGERRFKVSSADLAGKTYMGISLITEAWVMSLLTDTYGDVPYTEASKAKETIFLPKFDRQEDIYKDLLAKLEEANTLLTAGTNLSAAETAADPIFSGNALSWRKFGNSLYLRLLLRTSNKLGTVASGKIKEIVDTKASTYPIISNNAESAVLRWTGTEPYRSPFATWRPADWVGPGYTEFFIDHLLDWGDPRISKWADLYLGQYGGIPAGYPIGSAPTRKSKPLPALMTEPLLGNILNYAEVQFILAEAAARGWISGSDKTYYETGAANAITMWGLTVPSNYLTNPFVAWDANGGLQNKLEQIHLQKYYALYYTDFQQWFEFRRTGHPILPTGTGMVNGGKMPSRLVYPIYLQSSNKANLDAAIAIQGADNINTKVWWEKP